MIPRAVAMGGLLAACAAAADPPGKPTEADGREALAEVCRLAGLPLQEVRMRFNRQLELADCGIAAGRNEDDMDRAREHIRSAQTLVLLNAHRLPNSQRKAMNARAEALLDRAREEPARKHAALRRRARDLREEHKYKEALAVLTTITEAYPQDGWAREQRRVIAQFVFLLEDKERFAQQEGRKWTQDDLGAASWCGTCRRLILQGGWSTPEVRADARARQGMDQVLPRLHFDWIALADVLQFLRDVSNLPIRVDWEALKPLGVDQLSKVNVELSRTTVRIALEIILDNVAGNGKLAFAIRDGMVVISTPDDLKATTQPATAPAGGAGQRHTESIDHTDTTGNVSKER